MRHNLAIEGFRFGLRPVDNDDASFIVRLRKDPVLGCYLHRGARTTVDQLAWLEDYYQREGDYYFVIERSDKQQREGLMAIYDVDRAARKGEWGRWIVATGSLAAVESAWLVYRVAFEVLCLDTLVCRTVADNHQVVSFHDSCGIDQKQYLPGYFNLNGEAYDAVEHVVTSQAWPNIGQHLERLARFTARRV